MQCCNIISFQEQIAFLFILIIRRHLKNVFKHILFKLLKKISKYRIYRPNPFMEIHKIGTMIVLTNETFFAFFRTKNLVCFHCFGTSISSSESMFRQSLQIIDKYVVNLSKFSFTLFRIVTKQSSKYFNFQKILLLLFTFLKYIFRHP
jgi:hypothetical protein